VAAAIAAAGWPALAQAEPSSRQCFVDARTYKPVFGERAGQRAFNAHRHDPEHRSAIVAIATAQRERILPRCAGFKTLLYPVHNPVNMIGI
jgi:hypothetical protein